MQVTSDAKRITPRRPVEFVAACTDHRGTGGIHIAVYIATPSGMHRKTFACGPTQAGLVTAFRNITDWLAQDHGVKVAAEDTGRYRTFVEQQFGNVEKV